ncbi:MAG: hypothetical protein LBV72_06215 [Tannerella sp.]|jgi:uncharacterized protein YceK|nr:hypothetical protein [Tannerella sp.]
MKKVFLSLAVIAAMSLGAVHAQDTKTKKEASKTEQLAPVEEDKAKEGCCKDKKEEGCCKDKKEECKEKKSSCCSNDEKKK